MKSDIETARSIELKKIKQVVESMGVPCGGVEDYGRHIAKIPGQLIDGGKVKQSNLIPVAIIMTTKAGIGKITVPIGLVLGPNKIGEKAIVASREPPFGPYFGTKGGATGGGYTQVLPIKKINLHFTGDLHAITSAYSMISVLLNNYIYQHQIDGLGLRRIIWWRVLGISDRFSRSVVTDLGPRTNSVTMESGFDIMPVSEIMVIPCLSKDAEDLCRHIENMILGFDFEDKPFTTKDLGVASTTTVLLKGVIHLNLVQTIEGTTASVHSGLLANIVHNCNLILATKMVTTFGDYVVIEVGSGADLGAEKFHNIKCRKSGLRPRLTVIVATTQGLKMHGGVSLDCVEEPNVKGLKKGFRSLDKHTRNLHYFGQTIAVALNRFASDTDEEIEAIRRHCEEELEAESTTNSISVGGGEDTIDLTNLVVDTVEKKPSTLSQYVYEETNTV